MNFQFFFDLSIKNKIIVAILVILLTTIGFNIYYFPANAKDEITSSARHIAADNAALLAYAFAVAMNDENYEALSVGYDYVQNFENVSYVIIYDTEKSMLSSHNPLNLELNLNKTNFEKEVVFNKGYIEATAPITYKENEFGHVVIGTSLERVESKISSIYTITFGASALLILIAFAFGQFISGYIAKPLSMIASAAKNVADGDLTNTVEINQKDEVGQLAESFNSMIRTLKTNKDDIQHSMDMANVMVDEIKSTADELKAGNIKTRVKTELATGNFKTVLGSFNEALDAVVTPIHDTAEIMQKYAKGDLTKSLRTLPGDMKVLSDSTNEIRTNLQRLIDEGATLAKAAEEGELSKRGDESVHSGGYQKIIAGMNSTFENILKPVSEAVKSLEAMAQGDLSVYIKGDYKGDHALMKTAMNNTLKSLNEILNQVARATAQMDSGSDQVSTATTALSDGASDQASSLEELSSVMTEMGSQIKENAENAEKANTLGKTAQGIAHQGNAQMKDMLTAMQEINKASSDISQIIKVIDEIAFQTNLLALNAAVEAARAGQHGKGFAVVAEEVRSLAQRSAKAASETTALIEGSSTKVQNGSDIADKTATALTEIVDSITEVTGLIDAISSASLEQSKSIEQVNQSLTRIETVTQSNTASAEEIAAAAQEVASQSTGLNQMVKKFKLNKNNSSVTIVNPKPGSAED